MNKKLKLLFATLMVTTVLGSASACADFPNIDLGFLGIGNSSSSSESLSDSSVKKEKYTVRFVNEDNSVISEKKLEEGTIPEAPADPTYTADHYTYVFNGWDKEITAVEDDVIYKAVYIKTAIDYTVTFIADGVQVGEVLSYNLDNPTVVAPTVPAKEGYGGSWEEYTLDGGNKVVNAVYKLGEYTVTFKADGETVGTDTYTIDDKEITVPNVPAKDHYTGAWESYTLTTGDVVVNAVYTAIDYTVTFKADGVQVGEALSYNLDNPTVAEPAVPAKDHYTGAWESYTLDGGDKVVNAVYTAIDYTVTFMADGVQVGEVLSYNLDNPTVVAPTVPAKEGYGGSWEAYTLDGGDKVVNAVYKLGEYTVTFKADGETVDTDTYTIDDKEITVPEVPAKDHYTGAWESYTLTTGDVVVNAIYTAIDYTVTFKADGVQVGEVLSYNLDNPTVAEPAVPAKDHYTGAWESYALDGGDKVINAVYTGIEYTITFLNEVGETVGTATYALDNLVFDEPAVPAKKGYTGVWKDYELNGGNVEVTPAYTVNTYKIIYDANGGEASISSQEVVFGTEYTIEATATSSKSYQDFLGWVDGNGEYVTSGVWEIDSDVTLTAKYTDGITFENGVVPEGFSIADTTESLSVVEKDGSKVLQIHANGQAPAMNATVEFLASFFEDSSVDYIAFDARTDRINNNNFRRDTNRDGALTAVTYEQDMTFTHPVDSQSYPTTGIRADAWKTFYFSREDYDFWVAQGKTAARFIAAGGFASGDNIYLDNIRPATAAERAASGYSFESVGIRVNDAGGVTLLFYMLDYGTTWQFNMGSAGFTNVGLTSENVTHGRSALTFTKAAGTLSINLPSGKAPYTDIASKTGYWAIDVYVPEGAGATISKDNTGLSNGAIPGLVPAEGAWTTIYLSNTMNVLKIDDTNGGTYCIDNLRAVTAEEFTAAQYGFEAGTVGLRTNLLTDENTPSGTAYIYNKGADYSGVKASMNIGEGSAEGDANAVSNVRFDNNIVHSGSYSLAFDKGAGYVAMSRHAESEAMTNFAGGFTFWLYSTVDIDGVNGKAICDGVNGMLNGGEGLYIKANTWTQITITADQIGDGRFLILQGNWSGTIYLDDFQPLPAADAE